MVQREPPNSLYKRPQGATAGRTSPVNCEVPAKSGSIEFQGLQATTWCLHESPKILPRSWGTCVFRALNPPPGSMLGRRGADSMSLNPLLMLMQVEEGSSQEWVKQTKMPGGTNRFWQLYAVVASDATQYGEANVNKGINISERPIANHTPK